MNDDYGDKPHPNKIIRGHVSNLGSAGKRPVTKELELTKVVNDLRTTIRKQTHWLQILVAFYHNNCDHPNDCVCLMCESVDEAQKMIQKKV